jgi:hypothetical protein
VYAPASSTDDATRALFDHVTAIAFADDFAVVGSNPGASGAGTDEVAAYMVLSKDADRDSTPVPDVLRPVLGAEVLVARFAGLQAPIDYVRVHPQATKAEMAAAMAAGGITNAPAILMATAIGVGPDATTTVAVATTEALAQDAAARYRSIWATGLSFDGKTPWSELYGPVEISVESQSVIGVWRSRLDDMLANGSPLTWTSPP